MLKLKVGDKVRILQGRDRGREGTIAKIFPKKGKALVEGLNVYKKHVKKALTQDGKGGIFDISRPISLSKLALVDGKKTVKIGFKKEGNNKVRINKKTGKIIDKIK